MFAQLGIWIGQFLDGYVLRVVGTLTVSLTAVALLWLTVYIGAYGYAVSRGEASDSLHVFLWKMVKMTFIFSFALSSQIYMDVIYSTANGMQDSMAAVLISGPTYDDAAPVTVYASLDNAQTKADTLLALIWKDASIWRLDLVIASIGFSVGTVVFLVCGTIVVVLSKVLMAFVLAIGPISILTLMFKQTARFFESWLSTLLSAIVISWFVFYALGLSFFVVEKLITTMSNSGAFTGSGTVNAVTAAGTYVAFMCILAYIVFHSPHYASALTGGAAVQHGGQMLASFLGSRAGASSGSSNSTQGGQGSGGSVEAGGGGAYKAGRATGAAAGTAARAGASAAAATGRAAMAAYQRVARRASRR